MPPSSDIPPTSTRDQAEPRSPGFTAPDSGTKALSELRQAADRWHRPEIHSERSRGINWLLCVVVALATGLAFFQLGHPAEYRCTTTLDVPREIATDTGPLLMAELAQMTPRGGEIQSIRMGPAGEVKIVGDFGDAESGMDEVSALANELLRKTKQRIDALVTNHSEVETALTELAGRTASWTAELDRTLAEASDSLPAIDPTGKQALLMTRWSELRSRFQSLRSELALSRETVLKLENAPAPSEGIVSRATRERAMNADRALQEDLSELTVRLSGLRMMMRQAARPCEEALGEIPEALRSLADMVSDTTDLESGDGGSTGPLEDLSTAVSDYKALFDRFAPVWRESFSDLRKLKIDPTTGEVLDRYMDARKALGEYVYSGARILTSMRAPVDTLGSGQQNLAKYHVLRSRLIRGHELLRSAHERFEAAALELEPSRNFRIDAVVKSATGLRRRSQQRINVIDQRLNRKAIIEAREQQAQLLSEARVSFNSTRDRFDQTIDELIDLQSELNLTAEQSQAFVRSVVMRDLVSAQLERLQQEATIAEAALDAASARRRRLEEAAGRITVSETSATRIKVPVESRMQLAGVTALSAFVIVGFAQYSATSRHRKAGRGR